MTKFRGKGDFSDNFTPICFFRSNSLYFFLFWLFCLTESRVNSLTSDEYFHFMVSLSFRRLEVYELFLSRFDCLKWTIDITKLFVKTNVSGISGHPWLVRLLFRLMFTFQVYEFRFVTFGLNLDRKSICGKFRPLTNFDINTIAGQIYLQRLAWL